MILFCFCCVRFLCYIIMILLLYPSTFRLHMLKTFMLKDAIKARFSQALQENNQLAMNLILLLLTAINDREKILSDRDEGRSLDDEDILSMLQTMIEQRKQSMTLYEQEGRLDMAEEEAKENLILESFMPKILDETQTRHAVEQVIQELGANSIKDVKKTITELHRRYPKEMNFVLACHLVKRALKCNIDSHELS